MKWIWMVFILLLAACIPVTGPEPAPPPEQIELEGTRWQLQSMSGEPVVPGSTVTLQFDPDNVAGGNAGCNHYGGDYTLEGSTLEFEDLFSTMMYCMEEGIMDQEMAFLEALRTAESVSVENDGMTITYNGGQLIFVRAEE
jgi:heat shock protein HslJ